MSYNVLADELAHSHRHELYRRTPVQHLEWDRRWAMILQEIAGLAPDVVCLQEVDHWQQVEQDMQQMGYQGCYAQRSGGRTDGCATFWKPTCFESLVVDTVNFQDYDMRDNVGLLALLALKKEQQQVCVAVANTHTLFNPKRGDMKVGQLRLLLQRLQEVVAEALPAQGAAGVAALVMGDMNHQPHTPVYEFMRRGWVDCLKQHRKEMSGGLGTANPRYGAYSSSQPPLPPAPLLQQQLWQHWNPQQQQQQQQQWQPQGYPRGLQAPAHTRPGGSEWQQQQQQDWQQQQQQQRMLHHSSSAPSLQLTTRRLKNAGWSAEELITATGGAAGTHLLHFVQQHSEQQQQLEAGPGPRSGSAPAAVTAAAAAAAAAADNAGGTNMACDEQTPQRQQSHKQRGTGRNASAPAAAAPAAAGDGSSEPELATSSGLAAVQHEQHPEKQQAQQQGRKQRKWAEQQQQQQQLGHGSGRPQQAPQEQQQQQPDEAAAAAAAQRHKSAWSVQDKAQQAALKQLRPGGASEQQVAALTAQQQLERDQLKREHKRERKQLRQHQERVQAAAGQEEHLENQQQQQQPGNSATGVTGAVAAAAAGLGRVPAGAPLPPAVAHGTLNQHQPGQQQQQLQPQGRPPFPTFFSWGRELWDEALPAAIGDGIARHPLQLRSCYAEVTGSEPQYTSCHDGFFGTVDYVWYSTPTDAAAARLRPVAVLLPPCPDTHLPRHSRCMPNAAMPSDHICLCADFELSSEC